jgi:hypothetical protein
MLVATRPLTLLLLALGSAAARAQPPDPTGRTAPRRRRRRQTAVVDVRRWNDRTTPRKTLETFYFAISGYDRSPGLIANAIDCLDLSGLDPEMRERDAALLAHQLEFILNRQDIPLYGVPDRPEGDRVVLEEVAGQPIVLARQADGLWRFDAETVGRIGRLRKLAARGQREAQEARARLAEGRTDPATTIRSFAAAAMGRRDFALAARCLDLRDVPPKLRAAEGAQQARKLAFVMQRCAFLFTQEVPNDPDGYRYVWHSNHRGRILLERVRLPEGPGRLAVQPRHPAQPRRAGRGLPPQAPRPAVCPARRRHRRGRAGLRRAGAGAGARGASRPSSARPGGSCARSSSRWRRWSSTTRRRTPCCPAST